MEFTKALYPYMPSRSGLLGTSTYYSTVIFNMTSYNVFQMFYQNGKPFYITKICQHKRHTTSRFCQNGNSYYFKKILSEGPAIPHFTHIKSRTL